MCEHEIGLLERRQVVGRAEQDKRWLRQAAHREPRAEVGVGGEHDTLVIIRPGEDLVVGGGQQSQVRNVHGIVSAITKTRGDDGGQVGINQKSQPEGTSGSSRSWAAAAAYSRAARTSSRFR